MYDWSDVFATRSPGLVVCYLGTGTTSDQVTIQLSNTGFFQVAGDTLGFKGLVLTSTPEAAAIDVSNSGSLSVEDVTISGPMPVRLRDAAGSVTFSRTTFGRIQGTGEVPAALQCWSRQLVLDKVGQLPLGTGRPGEGERAREEGSVPV